MQITYTPSTGPAVLISGIFDEMYVLSSGDVEAGQAGVETLAPAVFLRLSDLPVDPEQDEPILTIGGVDYRVTERKTAGLGAIMLVLRRR